jgi:hypothetical protein
MKGNPTGDNSVKILLTVTTVSYTVSVLCKETNMHSAQPKSAMEMKRRLFCLSASADQSAASLAVVAPSLS